MSNSSIVTASVSDSVNIIAAGTQTANTSGTVVFSNSNNVSFGMTNNSIVTATATFNQTEQPGIQSLSAGTTRITTGEAVFSNSNNITFGANGQTITASVHAQQTGISSIVASNTTYTSGQVHFTGSNMVTVRSGTGQRVIIDATQTVQSQNLHALVVSNNTSGPFTIGTSGTVSFAGTNLTITANTANNSIIGFSVANPVGAGIGSISAGTTRVTSGEAVFSNSNNISFGVNGQTVTATVHPLQTGISSIFAGTTRATSGEEAFSNANNISFGAVGQTITASFSQSIQTQSTYTVPTLSKWENVVIGDTQHSQSLAVENATFWLVDMSPGAPVFPGNMTVSTAFIDVEATQTATSVNTAANSHSWKIGIYTG